LLSIQAGDELEIAAEHHMRGTSQETEHTKPLAQKKRQRSHANKKEKRKGKDRIKKESEARVDWRAMRSKQQAEVRG